MRRQPASFQSLAVTTILQIGALMPSLERRLAAQYDLHKLPAGPEITRFLGDHGSSIEAIASSARAAVAAEIIDALPRLRIIANFGVGYDNVDIARARARGVLVSNTPDVLTECVADLAIALMIDVARGVSAGDRFVRAGRWREGPRPFATRVTGRRLGIVGLGRIGQATARRAEAFALEIRYNGRAPKPGVSYAFEPDLQALARWSDFLFVSASGGESTRGLISAAVLEALGPEGYFINVARGTVVDEPALVQALSAGRIAGAALDVFVDEPRVPEALLGLDNVVLTPHIASATHETREAMAQLVLDNLSDFFATGRARTPV